MSDVITDLKAKAKLALKSIVFPESDDERVLMAVEKLAAEQLVVPFLLGDASIIKQRAADLNISLEGVQIRDPAHDVHLDVYVDELVMLRKHKGMTMDKARELLTNKKYFAAMMVRIGHVDGCVTGATHPTSETIIPAVQVIGMQEGCKRASSYFLMVKDDMKLFFADCGFVVNPDAEELSGIAIATNDSAKEFGVSPKVAMLSFSTKGSAQHELINKVVQATKIVQEARPDILVDGELQFDAAFVPSVAKRKAPSSSLLGCANVFVFPDLQSGNIAYKIAQRLGGFEAFGPVLQGLKKPMNDLSRGCSVDDIVNVALITVMQSLRK